jgi:hypothetical protein
MQVQYQMAKVNQSSPGGIIPKNEHLQTPGARTATRHYEPSQIILIFRFTIQRTANYFVVVLTTALTCAARPAFSVSCPYKTSDQVFLPGIIGASTNHLSLKVPTLGYHSSQYK